MGFTLAAGTAYAVPLFFFTALLWASVQDVKAKEVGDYIHVIIAVIAFVGLTNFPAMLTGALVSALPLFIAGVVKPGCIGGADIKLMAASGLILGAERGFIALIIGLTLGVGCTFIYRKIKKADLAVSFPLVPYLSAGCVVSYLI
jgi:leader peptidase (prepilin peptidase)/N-methyltransferase